MRSLVSALAMSLALAVAATTAAASPVVVGSPLTASFPKQEIHGTVTVANDPIESPGATIVSPVSGAVIRWNILDPEGGPFALRVLHPSSGGAWTAAGTSAPQTFSGVSGKQTVATDLPIQSGDLVGLDLATGVHLGAREVSAPFEAIFWTPLLPDGQTERPVNRHEHVELAFNAEVQPAPAVTAISPTSGFFKGGGSVTISGTDFASVSKVSFGGVPAASFAVNSESQIVVPAPPGALGAAADVTVTTVAGTSAAGAADLFTYSACKVPKLKGLKLKAVKKKLSKAGCRTGKVTKKKGVTGKTGKVVKQGAKAGKKLKPGSKIAVKLG